MIKILGYAKTTKKTLDRIIITNLCVYDSDIELKNLRIRFFITLQTIE